MMLGCGEKQPVIKLDARGETLKLQLAQPNARFHLSMPLCVRLCHRGKDNARLVVLRSICCVSERHAARQELLGSADVFPIRESQHTLKLREYFGWNVSPARRGGLLRCSYTVVMMKELSGE
jgi:hypothetical protein